MAADQQPQPPAGASSKEPPTPKGPADLQELYLQVRDKPCRVDDVRIEAAAPPGAEPGPPGPLRLNEAILDRELARVYEAATLKEVHEALETAVEHLRQLEAFDDITALIDSQPQDEPDACTVHLLLQEAGRYKFGGGTYTQAGEYSLELNAVARNPLGMADQWTLTGEIGTRNSKNLNASFRLPRAGGSAITPEVRVYQAFNNQQLHSSWTEAMRGISLGIRSAATPGVSLSYEYGWRSLAVDPLSSRSVRSQAGDYLKAALRCSYVFQGGGRSSGEVLPTEGWQLRLTGEVGGAAPGASQLRYVRQAAHLSWAAQLADGVSLHLETAAGLLVPCWRSAEPGKPSPLPERFYLGGVESNLRGFDTRGVGPSEPRRQQHHPGASGTASGSSSGSGGSGEGYAAAAAAAAGQLPMRDALGGDLCSNVYTALMFRLPGKAGDVGVHGHVFANGGSAVLLAGGSSSSSSGGGGVGGVLGSVGQRVAGGVQQMGRSFRWSTGFGLVFPTQIGRLEANYCWVLTSQEHDRVRRGFSFGFAANMGL